MATSAQSSAVLNSIANPNYSLVSHAPPGGWVQFIERQRAGSAATEETNDKKNAPTGSSLKRHLEESTGDERIVNGLVSDKELSGENNPVKRTAILQSRINAQEFIDTTNKIAEERVGAVKSQEITWKEFLIQQQRRDRNKAVGKFIKPL